MSKNLTVSAVATELGYPDWRVRRVLDLLRRRGDIALERAGLYRLLKREDLPKVVEELARIAPNAVEDIAAA